MTKSGSKLFHREREVLTTIMSINDSNIKRIKCKSNIKHVERIIEKIGSNIIGAVLQYIIQTCFKKI